MNAACLGALALKLPRRRQADHREEFGEEGGAARSQLTLSQTDPCVLWQEGAVF